MKGILLLQNEYLIETNEAKKNQILSDLYIEIIKLGKFILQLKKFDNSVDDIYDLASSVCMRLIEKQQPIIKSAPSQYISNSLYFMNKSKFHDSLDAEDADEPYHESFEKDLVDNIEYEKLLSKISELVASETQNKEVAAEIMDCVVSNTNFRRYSKEISKDHKKEFNRVLKLVREFLTEGDSNEWS